MEDTIKKPPVGAKPASIWAGERICELAGAIDRYANDDVKGNRITIKRWAEEIIAQVEIIEKFPNYSSSFGW